MILVEVLYRYTSSSLITGNKSERCRKYTILYLDVRNKKNFVKIFRYFFFLFFHFSHRDRSFLRKWIINLFALTWKKSQAKFSFFSIHESNNLQSKLIQDRRNFMSAPTKCYFLTSRHRLVFWWFIVACVWCNTLHEVHKCAFKR